MIVKIKKLEGCSNTSGTWCSTHFRNLYQCRDEEICNLKLELIALQFKYTKLEEKIRRLQTELDDIYRNK